MTTAGVAWDRSLRMHTRQLDKVEAEWSEHNIDIRASTAELKQLINQVVSVQIYAS